jgi:tripartite-type tricarboxylate transporter receptor subunit TctC
MINGRLRSPFYGALGEQPEFIATCHSITGIGLFGKVMWIISHSRRVVFLTVAFMALVTLCSRPVASCADEWPSRPITFVVSFPAGAATDFAAREIAQNISDTLGQPIIVENKPGAAGVVGTTAVAKAQPDGYSFLITAIGPAVLRPLIDKKLPYNPFADFTPVILVGETPNGFAVKTDSLFRSIKDVITYAKQNPGKITIGHPGTGTIGHLIALLFVSEAGIEGNLIPYQGATPLFSDLLGGHIQIASIAYGPSAHNVKFLGVTSNERIDFLPEVPTISEVGLFNVTGTTWVAIYAPAGTPPQIISKLNNTINTYLSKDETKKNFTAIGFQILGGTPERLEKQMTDDYIKWSKIIAGAKLN